MNTEKPNLSFWQIWNMSFGFLGIQYGFGLQQANMSPIYRYLGASEHEIPGLWLAGPLTGLLLQPIIGSLSDKSWSPKWGRRKPYVFIGAVVGSIAMVLMPNSSSVLMAASLMWLLDAGLNSSMEPFRAFVGDILNERQRPLGFSVQSFMVGLGQTLANLMPFILPIIGIALATTDACGFGSETDIAGIPDSVKFPFYIGAAAILVTVIWTMYTTKEYPPVDESYKLKPVYTTEQKKNIMFWRIVLSVGAGFMGGLFAAKTGGLLYGLIWAMGLFSALFVSLGIGVFSEVLASLSEMPLVMRKLWWSMFFVWYGLPLMWQYLSLSVAKYAFNASSPEMNCQGFAAGTSWGSFCFGMFSISCFIISIFIPSVVKFIGSKRLAYAIFLCIGAIGFFSTLASNDKFTYLFAMGLIGIAWGAIMSIPYMILASQVSQEKMGVYMGIFNGFICVPQFIGMLTVPLFYKSFLGNDPRNALIFAGFCMLFAAASCFLIDERKDGGLAQD